MISTGETDVTDANDRAAFAFTEERPATTRPRFIDQGTRLDFAPRTRQRRTGYAWDFHDGGVTDTHGTATWDDQDQNQDRDRGSRRVRPMTTTSIAANNTYPSSK